jgi:hypothetical protein
LFYRSIQTPCQLPQALSSKCRSTLAQEQQQLQETQLLLQQQVVRLPQLVLVLQASQLQPSS